MDDPLMKKLVVEIFEQVRSFNYVLNNQNIVCYSSYRVCHGFRLTKNDDYFQVKFNHSWIEAARVVSLTPNNLINCYANFVIYVFL